MYKIFLSPSNQDDNIYYDKKTSEYENCELIAKYAKSALERCGFEVKVGEYKDNMDTRCKKSVEWGADLHLPIHTNAYNGKAVGIEVYYYKNADKATKNEGIDLAKTICKAFAKVSPSGKSRGAKEGTFEELRKTPFCAYTEIDFHDNKDACAWLTTEQKNIGETFCKAICEHYGVEYVSECRFKVGDRVMCVAHTHYTSSTGNKGYNITDGIAKITAINENAPHPYHLVREKNGTSNVYGWVDKEGVLPIKNIYAIGDAVNIVKNGVERSGIVKSFTDTEIVISTDTIEY